MARSRSLSSKVTGVVSYLGVALLLATGLLLPFSLAHPNTAHAADTPPAYRFTKIFDTSSGSSDAGPSSVTSDSQGNLYETGAFQGTTVFDGIGGSDSRTSANSDSYLTKYNANGSYAWTKIFDTSGGSAEAGGVTTDSQGNIYETGDFQDTVVFDGVGGSDSRTSSDDSTYLTKYNANGTYAWTKTFSTTGLGSISQGHGVATDSSGNVFITGYFNGTIVFDGVGGSDSRTSDSQNVFLTKYNANGTYAWTKIFDSSAGGSSAGENFGAVATDPQGNVYFNGYFDGTVVFDGVGGSDTRTVVRTDTFLTKYNANGTYGWTKIFDVSGSSGTATATGVTTDNNGNIYELSGFHHTVIFDGVGGSDSRTSDNGNGAITKYNSNGTYGWTRTFDTSAGDAVLSEGVGGGISADNQGGVYVASWFQGTVVFDGVGGSDSRTSDNGSAFLTKYNDDGTYGWTKITDTSADGGFSFGSSVVAAATGSVSIVGNFNGTVVFDGVGGSDSRTSANTDAFLTSYQSFTPSQTAVLGATTTPSAPNTGFGVYTTSPLRTLAIYGLASLGLEVAALASRRLLYRRGVYHLR